MANEFKSQVTSEEISRGDIPAWLREHIEKQALGPSENNSNHSGRILVIYPNEESRKQIISEMPSGQAFDRTLHHTISSLMSSLVADLRLPRILRTEGAFEIVLDELCRKEAANLAFPIINPLPDMLWGRNKTTALNDLHKILSRESISDSWDGPGISSFRKIITKIENRLGGSHPDMVVSRIIEGLKCKNKPFTLLDVDGIIILDHPPETPGSHRDLLLALSKHCPIHQLAHPGNFRIGHHGILLLDQYPIQSKEELPNWIPPHHPEVSSSADSSKIIRLQREEDSFNAAIDIALDRLEENNSSQIIIVDPALNSNFPRWERELKYLGLKITNTNTTISSLPLGNWLSKLAKLAHGTEAFSLESIRSISLQTTLSIFSDPENHPSDDRIHPRPDSDILTQIARNEHVLGGYGAFSKWLEVLSKPPIAERDGISKESTQWWLLCVADSLRPLLGDEDCKVLNNATRVGCYTGKRLPEIEPIETGDEWLLSVLGLFDSEARMELCDSSGLTPAAVVQAVYRNLMTLRSMQKRAGISQPISGPRWVEEFTTLIRKSSIQRNFYRQSGSIRVLSPKQALGCTAQTIILANLSSTSWNLKPPKVSFLGDRERNSLDLLRPDGPIREARHYLEHLLAAAPEVLVLDPSKDKSSPLAVPISELIKSKSSEDFVEFEYEPKHRTNPRAIKQSDGRAIRSSLIPSQPPINISAISISLDSELQRDREMRQPIFSEDDGYLADSESQHLVTLDRDDLLIINLPKYRGRTPPGVVMPRHNSRWPVIGGRVPKYTGKTPTIDPRPISPIATEVDAIDSRHGYSAGAEQETKVWSPSRLQTWLECPRKGWLSDGLRTNELEQTSEDIDPRTHGQLLHEIHHEIIANTLDFEVGVERQIGTDPSTHSVTSSGKSEDEIMAIALESLARQAPWLERTDAISKHRIRMLTGMDIKEWRNWLIDPKPIEPLGRIGSIVKAESKVSDSIPVCLEWSLADYDNAGIEISVPANLSGPQLPSIRVRGYIDRVDILPFDDTGRWMNPNGDESIAPLKLLGSNWKPRRLVAIRDLKTSNSSPAKRHKLGLLSELQLALYARAWEIAHPGDLVVASGISTIGHETQHLLESSSQYCEKFEEMEIGKITEHTAELHRFLDESRTTKSDHFRAWLTQRLVVALRVAAGAAMGRVHPIPTKGCTFCKVRNSCNVRMEDELWLG